MDISCPYGGERHIAGMVYVPYCNLPAEETPHGPIPGECAGSMQTDCRYRPFRKAQRQVAIDRIRSMSQPVPAQREVKPHGI